ncbi:WhiB family transcriptional regulator [Streptomyces sp. NPDC056149]|uniref:WhiB family transcriptional regulator n=1 Tax=Streptomyces sp. NPDC056149 TaxID=3345728 RepID=UPI0035DF9C1F
MHPLAIKPPPFVPPTEETPLPCTTRPDVYFAPDHPESHKDRMERIAAAQLLCAGCDEERRAACAAWARTHREWGVWGGRTERQNGYKPRNHSAGPGTGHSAAVCGTEAGARAHYRRGERPCAACGAAARQAAAERKRGAA